MRIERVEGAALSVPLLDPFVIASGRVDATRSVLVRVYVDGGIVGLGEGAALPPVTREDQTDVLATVTRVGVELTGKSFASVEAIAEALEEVRAESPVAAAGLECALLDALARTRGVPVRTLLGGARGSETTKLVTDITIPILAPERMATLARTWRARGFTCFKVKVGKDVDRDLIALEAIARAVGDATFRIDANAGFSAKDAITLARGALSAGLVVECWEEPCAKGDLDAMAEVTAALEAPVIADESVASLADLARVVAARAADGINLKLVKSGGAIAAYALGCAARDAGMALMVGGMVETRLGMTAAAHVGAALGGVEFPDLDTAWLLASDPFEGGYEADGPRYTLAGAGFGVRDHERAD